jgi:glucosamine-6-phosphate deaminase
VAKREIEFLPLKTFAFDGPAEAVESVARETANLIRNRKYQRADAALGLSTGRELLPFFDKLVEMSGDETKGGLPISSVRTFLTAELLGAAPGSAQSFSGWLDAHLFARWNSGAQHRYRLDGSTAETELAAHCAAYEERLKTVGPLDLIVVALGADGSLGLNPPGTSAQGRTAPVALGPALRQSLAAAHGVAEVPARALALGPASIRGAKRVRVYAFGADKAAVVERGLLPEADPAQPLSLLVGHKDVELILDAAAAAALE